MSMDDAESLGEARDWLRSQIDDGAICPCCKQFVKVYRRQINSTMVRALVALYQHAGTDSGHWPTILNEVGIARADEAKLAYWGLVEEEPERREDGGRAGWWTVTAAGVDWIEGRITIPRYAKVYNGRCRGLEGELRTIQQALGTRFNYQELMGL